MQLETTNLYAKLNNLNLNCLRFLFIQILNLRINFDRLLTGPPRLARPPRPGPCLDFGFQDALTRNNWSKKNWDRILGLAWLKFTVASLRLNMYLFDVYLGDTVLNVIKYKRNTESTH